jgi:hypothetical protein
MLKSVVFPAPFGPIIETISPGFSEKDTLLTAFTPPKLMLNCSTERSVTRFSL